MTGPRKVALLTGPLVSSDPNVAALDLAVGLAERGTEVTVLAGDGPLAARFAEKGVAVTAFDLTGHLPADLPRLPEMRAALRALGAGLLHVTDQIMARHGALLARLARCPLVLTVTDPGAGPGPERSSRLRGVIAPSPAAHDELVLGRGFPRSRITVIPPWVDLSRFPEPASPLTGPTPILGAMTVLDRDAGLPDLLAAVRLLLAEGLSLQLIIAGHGPEEEALRRSARDLGIQKHVTVSGVPRDFERILDTLDVFVHPRRREWTGYGLLQGMAAGRPVVAAGAGAAFTLVREGETGFLVPAGNPVALAERIRTLIGDPERARVLGGAGRRVAAEVFSVARAVDRLLPVYEEAVGGER